MVTGFLALAIGIYQRNTGDDRYAKQTALDMKVTDKKSYKHDYHSLYRALVDNWSRSNFVLYPCEVSTGPTGWEGLSNQGVAELDIQHVQP
jgi:hypothetical protein